MSNLKLSICILCGLPAAGKSTFLNFMLNNKKSFKTLQDGIEKSENLTKSLRQIVGIQYDVLLPFQLYTEQETENVADVKLWKNSRHDVVLLVNALIQELHSCQGKNLFSVAQPEGIKDDLWQRFVQLLEPLVGSWDSQSNEVLIVIDDNMHLRSMRYEYYKLARACGAGYCQIFLEVSLDRALERNCHRTGMYRVSDDVITKMAQTFEIPDGSKHAWEKFSFTISQESDVDKDQIISFIRTAFLNPVQPALEKNAKDIAASRSQCSSSLLHQADLILRKCVSAWLAECKMNLSPIELQQCVKNANKIKENILNKLRNGECDISFAQVSSLQYAVLDSECSFYKFIEKLFLTNIKMETFS